MRDIYAAVGIFATLVRQSHANLDVITLPTNGNAYIQEVTATLVLGETPNPIAGDVALWSAITMDQGDFLQGVTENAKEEYWCQNLGANWCNFAYALVGGGTTNVKNGEPVAAAPGSRVKTHYKLNSSTNMWDQNLYINDTLMSTISTSQGQHGTIFYVSIECASGTCSAAPAHSWEDISVILSEADSSFLHSGSWSYDATGGEMSTPDNGKTWNFTTLSIPETAITG